MESAQCFTPNPWCSIILIPTPKDTQCVQVRRAEVWFHASLTENFVGMTFTIEPMIVEGSNKVRMRPSSFRLFAVLKSVRAGAGMA